MRHCERRSRPLENQLAINRIQEWKCTTELLKTKWKTITTNRNHCPITVWIIENHLKYVRTFNHAYYLYCNWGSLLISNCHCMPRLTFIILLGKYGVYHLGGVHDEIHLETYNVIAGHSSFIWFVVGNLFKATLLQCWTNTIHQPHQFIKLQNEGLSSICLIKLLRHFGSFFSLHTRHIVYSLILWLHPSTTPPAAPSWSFYISIPYGFIFLPIILHLSGCRYRLLRFHFETDTECLMVCNRMDEVNEWCSGRDVCMPRANCEYYSKSFAFCPSTTHHHIVPNNYFNRNGNAT